MKFLHHIGLPHCVGWLNQFMRIMRLTIIIIIITLMQVSASGLAQKVNLRVKNAPLEQVLATIKQQTSYNFVYTENVIAKAKTVTLNLRDTELKDALKVCFENQPLNFAIEEQTIVISEKTPTFLERLANRWASIDVSGLVVDADGKGLPGASVSVKGKGRAVSTGANGVFLLKGVEEGATLVVSFIGYLPKEIKAVEDLGDVMLEVSLSKLDEVQVIAYGTTTQRLSTGNVTTIKAADIEKQPVNNPLLALQGRVPGLFIEQATGFAGTGVKVRIQGTNSIGNGNDPLYVIDGIPFPSQLLPGSNNPILGSSSGGIVSDAFGNPMNFINPSDIESIDVLKDADATAIYGSRAANGAILITTKKGKSGETKVDINIKNGWGNVARKMDLMNAQQYLEMRREALRNDRIIAPVAPPFGDSDLNGIWNTSRNIDWQKELVGGSAQYNDVQTSISGGRSITTFLVGAGYHRETNVFPGEFSDSKGSIHFNINNSSTNQRFKLQFSGSFLHDKNLLPQVDLTSYAMTLAPVAPNLYNTSGAINWQSDKNGLTTFGQNPIQYLFTKYSNKTENLNANGILSYLISENLEIKSSFGYNSLTSNTISYRKSNAFPPETPKPIYLTSDFGNSSLNSFSIEPQLNYSLHFAKGKFFVVLGATIQQENTQASSISGSGFVSDLVMEDIKSASSLKANLSLNNTYKYAALFGQINYNWENKYIINFTARRDGSSRFGSENQSHSFGAIGSSWIFSEENFVKDKLGLLSFGKLKASFGTTGSDQIGDYRFLSLYSGIDSDVPYQGIKGYMPTGLSNPTLQWEETKKLLIGVDLGFLKDRFLLNANFSLNRSSNQLLSFLLPIQTGYSEIPANLPATVQNRNWELMLSTTNFNTKHFTWKSSINLTIPKNKLISYPGLADSNIAGFYQIGQSVNLQYLYRFSGVDPLTGVYQFADRNRNPTTSPSGDDLISLSPDPKFYGGFLNTFSYKGFQLDFIFQFVRQIGPNYRFGNNPPGLYFFGKGNQPTSLVDRWQNVGDITTSQRYNSDFSLYGSWANAKGSDASWSDASYIRLKNLSISWQLPPIGWTKRLSLQNVKIYTQGQNLLTITKYQGLDPESKSSLSLPPLRVFTFGIQIGI